MSLSQYVNELCHCYKIMTSDMSILSIDVNSNEADLLIRRGYAARGGTIVPTYPLLLGKPKVPGEVTIEHLVLTRKGARFEDVSRFIFGLKNRVSGPSTRTV